MADYIKPFICDHKGNNNKLKEKLEQKEEEKPIAVSGMGDFDYENFPVAALAENTPDAIATDILDNIYDNSKKIMDEMDNEMAVGLEDQRYIECALGRIEKVIKTRYNLYDMCLVMSKEETMELRKCSENNKKIDSTINYLQQMIDSWQCLIDDFRKIPDECE